MELFRDCKELNEVELNSSISLVDVNTNCSLGIRFKDDFFKYINSLNELHYFLIPSSNENNFIYLRSSEWGKHDKQQQISSSRVVLSFVFYQDFLFLHHLTSETNNKALIQITSQYFDMTHAIAALSYFPVTLNWNKTHIVATLNYFPPSKHSSWWRRTRRLQCNIFLSSKSSWRRLQDVLKT